MTGRAIAFENFVKSQVAKSVPQGEDANEVVGPTLCISFDDISL